MHPGPFAIAVEPAQRRLAVRLRAVRFVRFATLRVALRLAGALRFAAFLAVFLVALRFAGALRFATLRVALRLAGAFFAALRFAGAFFAAFLAVAFFAGGTVTTFLESSHSREVRTSRVFTRRVRECGLTPYAAMRLAPGP